MRILHADHVLPGDERPIADGAVVVDDGEVIAVGRASAVLPAHAGAPIERIHGVLFPGTVNAHVHLELSALHGRVPGGCGFVRWVDDLIDLRAELDEEESKEGIDLAVHALRGFATEAVGEVTNTLGAVTALARAGIGGWIFHEIFGKDRDGVLKRIAGLPNEVAQRLPAWPTRDLDYAPAPHTLYTTHFDAVRALAEAAFARDLRTSLHLAEHASERRAIEQGDGPMVDWFEGKTKQRSEWPCVPLFDYAEVVGVLHPAMVLVHLTDARPDELKRVAESGASVVLCPRSNLHIENRLPPLLTMLEAGLAPALGTDSLASNASLDVLAEARTLHERFLTVPAWEIVRMATWNGARALGRTDLGRIAKGARPGLYAVEGDVVGDAAAHLLVQVGLPRRRVVPRLPEGRA